MFEFIVIDKNFDVKRFMPKIKDFKEEVIANNSKFSGNKRLKFMNDINEWINYTILCREKSTMPKNGILKHQVLLINKENDKILSMGEIRFDLNEHYQQFYGNIGYSVTPSEEKKGYGNQMMKFLIDYAKIYSLDKIIVLCSSENIASNKIIINNNGIFIKNVIKEKMKLNYYEIKQ